MRTSGILSHNDTLHLPGRPQFRNDDIPVTFAFAFDKIFPTNHERSFLSMARKPTFDPATFAQALDKSQVTNTAIRRIVIPPRSRWITALPEITDGLVSDEELKAFSHDVNPGWRRLAVPNR